MRIEIDDSDCYRHQIDTADPELAGRWFAEKAKLLMSADARWGQCKLRIWPSTHDEMKLIGQQEMTLTQDNLLAFAQHILEVSGQLGELEGKTA